MTALLCLLAGGLYALGMIPTAALIDRDRPLGPSKLAAVYAWPIAVLAWCIGAAVVLHTMRRARP